MTKRPSKRLKTGPQYASPVFEPDPPDVQHVEDTTETASSGRLKNMAEAAAELQHAAATQSGSLTGNPQQPSQPKSKEVHQDARHSDAAVSGNQPKAGTPQQPQIHFGEGGSTPRWVIVPNAQEDANSQGPPLRWQFEPGPAGAHLLQGQRLYRIADKWLRESLRDPDFRGTVAQYVSERQHLAQLVRRGEDPVPFFITQRTPAAPIVAGASGFQETRGLPGNLAETMNARPFVPREEMYWFGDYERPWPESRPTQQQKYPERVSAEQANRVLAAMAQMFNMSNNSPRDAEPTPSPENLKNESDDADSQDTEPYSYFGEEDGVELENEFWPGYIGPDQLTGYPMPPPALRRPKVATLAAAAAEAARVGPGWPFMEQGEPALREPDQAPTHAGPTRSGPPLKGRQTAHKTRSSQSKASESRGDKRNQAIKYLEANFSLHFPIRTNRRVRSWAGEQIVHREDIGLPGQIGQLPRFPPPHPASGPEQAQPAPDEGPNRAPKRVAKRASKPAPKRTSKRAPKRAREETPEAASKAVPEQTPKQAPKRAPKRALEEASEEDSEEAPKQAQPVKRGQAKRKREQATPAPAAPAGRRQTRSMAKGKDAGK
ncbi:hypothetical protein ASPCADRAFT_129718 [Aspergillus carbonarius ITEM 5010]|uniref:Uncharacterized protein n=1 Tax=Aspergillus carbonarius (strain ITEM 5010) TaxID=602072 RepID=A0A1R3RQ80_ASPC5|nr:hypothetical protein ASPCADRAFT_129718 [Aspergillus carbonarius ITEM 5010]